MISVHTLRLLLLAALVALATLLGVFAQAAKAAHPAPVTGKVVFVSDRDGDNEIYVMEKDGAGLFKVTDNTYNDTNPAYGPGGGMLAFVSNRDGNNEIYLSDDNGGPATRLTNNAANDERPAWSNNGAEIAFTRTPTGEDSEIYSVSTHMPEGSIDDAGTTQTDDDETVQALQLTNNILDDDRVSFAPDGRLAFDRKDASTQQRSIVTMPSTGDATETNIALSGAGSEWDPDWAPDGSHLYYVKKQSASSDIWKMNPDGTSRSAIIATVNKEDSQPFHYPTASLGKLMYTSNSSGNFEIWRANADGSGKTNISNNVASDIYPDVRPVNNTRSIQTELETELEDVETPTQHSAIITFSERESYENATGYECRIDGGLWSACASPVTYTGLSLDVEHTFEVKGTSGGVTETPVSESWTTSYTVNDTGGMGLILPGLYYNFGLDNLFGHIFGHDYATLSGENQHGSPAASRTFGQGFRHHVSYLESTGGTDNYLKVCNGWSTNFPGMPGAVAKAWDQQARKTTTAISRNIYNCNTTKTNRNHEWHKTKNGGDAYGSKNYH